MPTSRATPGKSGLPPGRTSLSSESTPCLTLERGCLSGHSFKEYRIGIVSVSGYLAHDRSVFHDASSAPIPLSRA